MMRQRQIWWWGGAALVAVWLVAVAGMAWARARHPTAEKAVEYLRAHPLEGRSEADRWRAVEGLAERVNRLTFEERQKFRYEGRLREWFEELTEAERRRYLDLTLPKGLKQMMEAFNSMGSARRKQIVNRALSDLSRVREDVGRRDVEGALADQNIQRIIDEGMKSFLSDASADTKLDLEPLIEQIQNIMQLAR